MENVEIVENKLRGATKGYANATPWAPRVPLRNTGEQFLESPLRGLVVAAGRRGLPPLPLGWGRGGPQGTTAPTVGWGEARAAGDCRPYHGLGAGRAKHVAKR